MSYGLSIFAPYHFSKNKRPLNSVNLTSEDMKRISATPISPTEMQKWVERNLWQGKPHLLNQDKWRVKRTEPQSEKREPCDIMVKCWSKNGETQVLLAL